MAIQPLTHYNTAFLALLDGSIEWDDGATNVAAILCTSSYAPALAHATYADITNEVTDADYAPQAVTTRTTSRDGDEIQYKSDPVDFGAEVTIAAQYLILVQGDAASLQTTDPLIGYVDFGEAKSSTAAAFKFTPASSGWFHVTRAACP